MSNDNFPPALQSSRRLVSTDWLAEHLRDPKIVVVDATYFLPQHNRDAHAEYKNAHIPGAVFFDIEAISDHSTELPHMLPGPTQFGGTRIDNLGAVIDQRHAHIVEQRHRGDVHVGSEFFDFRLGLAALKRAAFRFPFWQAAVEHMNGFGAENPKCPPHPSGGKQRTVVINDHDVAIADTERANRIAELRPARQHMRQLG